MDKINTTTFFKGMTKDLPIEMLQEGQYNHAINAVNNSDKGDFSKIGNEPSNLKCVDIPYTFNGSIALINERFLIFSTNDIDSEIGIFNEQLCTYQTLLNDSKQVKKIGLKLTNPVFGVSREIFGCDEGAYWNDGINPARFLNINKVPYVIKFKKDPLGGCDIETPTDEIDIEKLRLTPLLNIPNITLEKGDSGGSIPNGSARVAIAYSEPLFRITDYLAISDVVFLHSQTTPNGSLRLTVENTDNNFSNYEVVLITTINQQTTARLVGRYPVEQKTVYIDSLSQTDEVIDLQNLALQSVYYEGGDAMFNANGYLIQTGPRTRPQFNYQPQANKIRPKWVSYAVPQDYYRKSGTKIGYTKGEIITPFIRFVYNTGHRTESFPIPNREANAQDKQLILNQDSKSIEQERVEKHEIYDTSTITKIYPRLNQEEYIIAEGEFGYYESTDTYPDNKEVWGNNACKPIRLCKFPDNCVVPNFDQSSNKLQILGFKLENITYPLDENGNPVEGIVGYEILRGDKEGNKIIAAKGLIYNTGEYDLPVSYNDNIKGLYPNFPFNDLRPNTYLSKKWVRGGCNGRDYEPVTEFNRSYFTFHSPETSFQQPVLPQYLKVEAEYRGTANGWFEECHKHPKHKLIRDFALIISGAVGIGEGLLAIKGKTTKTYNTPEAENKGEAVGSITQTAGAPVVSAFQQGYNQIRKNLKNIPVIGLLSETVLDIVELAGSLIGITPGAKGSSTSYTTTDTAYRNIPSYVSIGTNVVLFSYFFGQGTETTLEVIRTLVPYRQHGWQCNMDGIYTTQVCPQSENKVRKIDDYSYLYPNFQDFQGYRINNDNRESSIILKLNQSLQDPTLQDNSRNTIGDLNQWENPSNRFNADISAHYVSIFRKDKNIYGQLDTIKIVPTDGRMFQISENGKFETPIIFGGDTIIEEFSLKRKVKLFTQNQGDPELGNPNGYEFDYKQYPNIIYPRYWMDTQRYDITQLFNLANIRLPNDSFYLDRNRNECRSKVGFSVNRGYMYTSVNAVVRFYVESSYNLPFRKNNQADLTKKHFDKQFATNISELLRNDILDFDNNFEIDRSLSPIKQINFTYSQMQNRDFSVKLNKCFTYEPNRLLYSLRSQLENRVDNWRNFLTNNYFTFSKSDGKLIGLKAFQKTGVIYFFQNAPVKIHPGVDELQTEGGLKITLGDGGLFAREPQNMTNTDFDYSECQSSQGIVSTPYGVFFISQRQGKLFLIDDSPKDISSPLKWHLAEYLPSRLLRDFPGFELSDNPMIGVGCTAVYDNINEVVYFSKIDYEIKPEYKSRITYLSKNIFLLDNRVKVLLQNPTYFNSASFTLSMDAKTKAYISFHDWHPEGIIQSKTHFSTIKDQSIWKHNLSQDSFNEYYGVQKGWSIDVPSSNIQNVTTTESLEWYLECYRKVGEDRMHVLNDNFDRAVIYNTEQSSGNLKLNMRNKARPDLILAYPNYTNTGVEVEVTKTEQKYRLNQFRDLTKNRGEFTTNVNTLFVTEPNGYKHNINPLAIDYNKPPQERKKFRHIKNVVRLIKTKSENKMLLTLVNSKPLISPR